MSGERPAWMQGPHSRAERLLFCSCGNRTQRHTITLIPANSAVWGWSFAHRYDHPQPPDPNPFPRLSLFRIRSFRHKGYSRRALGVADNG